MGSKVLPQALITIPRNPNPKQYPNRKLVFSTSISGKNSSQVSSGCGVSLSRVAFGVNGGDVLSGFGRWNFVVRAENDPEAKPEGVVVAAAENAEGESVEEVVEGEGEGEGDAVVEEQEEKPPRKPRVKLGDIMGILNQRAIEASDSVRPTPDIRTGDIVEIKLEVPENRRRLSIYKGIVISRQNAGIHTTIRIRRIIAGVGVEIVFPLYSPNIKEIKVVNHRKVRRARLYYLRDKLPRLSTFK